jgi:hypothetical protein
MGNYASPHAGPDFRALPKTNTGSFQSEESPSKKKKKSQSKPESSQTNNGTSLPNKTAKCSHNPIRSNQSMWDDETAARKTEEAYSGCKLVAIWAGLLVICALVWAAVAAVFT